MAAGPRLWVYKCNAQNHEYQIAWGDWDDFFVGPQPGEWGGSGTIGSARSLDILWNEMQRGDLVLCWQTDRKRAVGLCRVDDLKDYSDAGVPHRDMWLELVGEPFSPPVALHELKKHDRKLASVGALKPGYISTLYETTAAEADVLLRACGISPATLKRMLASPSTGAQPHTGAGFGSPVENRKVELAAVKKLKAHYLAKGWRLRDRQQDKIGYDFDAIRGSQERHIELKGVRGPGPSFPITEGEVTTARRDPLWRLAVVTEALSKTPRLSEWTAPEFLAKFELRILSHMAKLR